MFGYKPLCVFVKPLHPSVLTQSLTPRFVVVKRSTRLSIYRYLHQPSSGTVLRVNTRLEFNYLELRHAV
jgi:hypothetical protein